MLTQSRLKELMHYDPITGVFTRIKAIRGKQNNSVAGSKCGNGYLRCMIDNKVYLMHRLAWLYMKGSFPAKDIDHINHDRSDNRFENLRDVSRSINHQNRSRKTNSASKYLGVTWNKQCAAWQAQIYAENKLHYLGLFKNVEEAVEARKKAELIYHKGRPLKECMV